MKQRLGGGGGGGGREKENKPVLWRTLSPTKTGLLKKDPIRSEAEVRPCFLAADQVYRPLQQLPVYTASTLFKSTFYLRYTPVKRLIQAPPVLSATLHSFWPIAELLAFAPWRKIQNLHRTTEKNTVTLHTNLSVVIWSCRVCFLSWQTQLMMMMMMMRVSDDVRWCCLVTRHWPTSPNHQITVQLPNLSKRFKLTHSFRDWRTSLGVAEPNSYTHTCKTSQIYSKKNKEKKNKHRQTGSRRLTENPQKQKKKPTSTTRIQDKATNTRLHSESSQHAPRRIKDFTQKHRSSPCFVHSRGQHFDLTLSQSLRQPWRTERCGWRQRGVVVVENKTTATHLRPSLHLKHFPALSSLSSSCCSSSGSGDRARQAHQYLLWRRHRTRKIWNGYGRSRRTAHTRTHAHTRTPGACNTLRSLCALSPAPARSWLAS